MRVWLPLCLPVLLFVALPVWAADEELAPGFYAVSCNTAGRGETPAAALRACTRAVRRAHLKPKECDCARHADVVRIEPGRRPAFYVAGETDPQVGTTRARAIDACRAAELVYRKRRPAEVTGFGCAGRVIAAYGPFDRQRSRGDFDDETVYKFLSAEGTWVDHTGEEPCFPAGTPVVTPGGPRPIEEIAAGDAIVSWSTERGEPMVANVSRVKRRQAGALLSLQLADGRTLRLTANHPLYVPGRDVWVAASELRAGDRVAALVGSRLSPVEITAVADETINVEVFDLTVEPTHAYFAGGILAHNY